MTERGWHEITETELDGLIERVQGAIEHSLALSSDDMQLLLEIVLSFAHLQERLSETDITVHKLRKLAGLVSASEKLKDLVGNSAAKAKPKRPRAPKPPKAPVEPVIHDRCQHGIEGLSKGQKCPECERGTRAYGFSPWLLALRANRHGLLACTVQICPSELFAL